MTNVYFSIHRTGLVSARRGKRKSNYYHGVGSYTAEGVFINNKWKVRFPDGRKLEVEDKHVPRWEGDWYPLGKIGQSRGDNEKNQAPELKPVKRLKPQAETKPKLMSLNDLLAIDGDK